MTEVVALAIEIDPDGAVRGAGLINDQLDSISKKSSKAGDESSEAAAKLSNAWKAAGGILAAVGISKFFNDATNEAIGFQSAISELQAITGAFGKDLEFLSKAAREMGASTSFSASQAAEAFKLVASAKPDLLDNVDALSKVTREVLSLAEAAGISLPEAAKIAGSTLNQFGEDANAASRFVNVLAAGAKFGASEIEETAAALRDSGTVASSVGLSFEETNAAIQLLANNAIKAQRAGTGLRNVLLILEEQDESLRPSVVGISQALKNLEERNLSTTEQLEIFGRETIVVAQSLINQADKFDELTAKMTGTNTAYDQAIVRTANLEGDQKRLNSTLAELKLRMDLAGDGARTITQTFDEVVKILFDLDSAVEDTDDKFNFFSETIQEISKVAAGVKFVFESVGDTLGAAAAQIVAAAELNFDKVSEISKAFEENQEKRQREFVRELEAISNINKELEKRKELEEEAGKRLSQSADVTNDNGDGDGEDVVKNNVLSFDPEKVQENFESIRKSLLDQKGLEFEFHKERTEIIKDFGSISAENAKKAHSILEKEELRHKNKLKEIDEKSAKARQAIEDKRRDALLSGTATMFGNLSVLMNTESRKLFEIGKAAAIAETIVSTFSAAQKQFDALSFFPPLAYAAAGTAIVAGIARVNAIKNTEFGGGGAASSPSIGFSVGGSFSQSPNQPGFVDAVDSFSPEKRKFDEQEKQGITININGDITGDVNADDFIQRIKELVNDSDFVLIEPTSRNGQELSRAL